MSVSDFRSYLYLCHYQTADFLKVSVNDSLALSIHLKDCQLVLQFAVEKSAISWKNNILTIQQQKNRICQIGDDSSTKSSTTGRLSLLSNFLASQASQNDLDWVKMEESWLPSFDNKPLYIQRWVPQGEIKAVAFLTFGTHTGFYKPIILNLCRHGFVVMAWDMRGHGRTSLGGTFPDIIDGNRMTVPPAPASDCHFNHTIRDNRFLIEYARKAFRKKVLLVAASLMSTVQLYFLHKAAGKPWMPDGVLIGSLWIDSIISLPPTALVYLVANSLPHVALVAPPASVISSRDANFLVNLVTNPLNVTTYSLGYFLWVGYKPSYLASLPTKRRFKNETKVPFCFLRGSRDFLTKDESAIRFMNDFMIIFVASLWMKRFRILYQTL